MLRSFFIIHLLLSSSLAFGGELYPALAQKTYEFWRGQKCENTTSKEAAWLRDCLICSGDYENTPASKLNDMSETIFFSEAGSTQASIIHCEMSKMKELTNNSSKSQRFRDNVIKDISSKILPLRKLHKEISELRSKKSINESAMYTMKGGIAPSKFKELQGQNKQIEKQLSEFIPLYGAYYQSIWNSDDTHMSQYLEKIIASDITPEEFEVAALKPPSGLRGLLSKNYSLNDVLKKILKQETEDYEALNEDRAGRFSNMSQKTKEMIVKRGEVMDSLAIQGKTVGLEFNGLACRLEGKYGAGTEHLDNTLFVGTLALGGTGLVAKLGSAGKIGSLLTARQSAISLKAARVLFAASAATGTALSVRQVSQACGNSNIRSPHNNCSGSDEFAVSELQEISHGNCALSVALTALPVAATYGFRVVNKVITSIPQFASKEVSIIWYPRAGYLTVSHTELRVGDRVYDNLMGTNNRISSKALQRAAKSKSGRAYFDFKLKVTDEEFAKLEKYMQDPKNKVRLQSCISGACAALRNNTNINIPPPFRYVPTMTALYITAAKSLGYSRITSIELVGKNVLKTAGLEIPNELWMGGGSSYLLLKGLDLAGAELVHVIPIERQSDTLKN